MIFEKDIENIQRDNLSEYYKEILISRAIPDIRDGLKPIHRRILWSMYEKKYKSSGPFVKCAKIVGDVLGSYSPHGDSSAYDAMTNLIKPWFNNVTLIDPHGSFGTQYGDKPASYRYCVTGDTEIMLSNNETILIKDIVPDSKPNSDNPINIHVKNVTGNSVKADMLFNCGLHDVYSIRVNSDGYFATSQIEATSNHPLLVFGRNLIPEWQTVEEINAKRLKGEPVIILMYFPDSLKTNETFNNRNSIYFSMKRLLDDNERLSKDEAIQLIRSLYSKNYRFSTIDMFGKVHEKKVVYSLRVRSDDHSYIGNHFINHNTQARLNKFSENLMLDNINDNSIDFIPNYDNTTVEPSILPSKLPLYLVNGAFGIAAGYMVSVPPHNIKVIVDKTIDLLKNPDIGIDEFVNNLYPDFPSGGIVCNKSAITNAYKDCVTATANKSSNIILRSKIEKDEKSNTLTVTEIPYMKSLDDIIDQIKGHVSNKNITGIKNIKDASTNGKINLMIECYKDENLNIIENQLYAFTELQTTIPLCIIGILNNKFRIYDNIKQVFEEWISFRITTVKRIKMENIRKKKYRTHILDGLIKCLGNNNIDKVIKIIRNGKNKQDILNTLAYQFELSDIQAKYIIELQIYRLNKLQILELENERDLLDKEIKEETTFFAEPKKINEYIIHELEDISSKYKSPIKTTYRDIVTSKEDNIESVIPDEDYLMILTKNNYLKKIICDIKSQNRGGLGKTVGNIKEDDVIKCVIKAHSKDNILFFTSDGKVYSRKAYELQKTSLKSYGNTIKSMTGVDSKVVSIIAVSTDDMKNSSNHMLLTTKLGKIKMTNIQDFTRLNSGIIAAKLNDGDEVLTVNMVDINSEFTVLSVNKSGMAINISKVDIPIIARTTYGVNIFKSSKINNDNTIVNSMVITNNTKELFMINNNGLGKRVSISEFPVQGRAGIGRIAMRMKTNKDYMAQCIPISEGDKEILIVSNKSVIVIELKNVALSLRPAYGNNCKRCTKGEFVIDCCII